MTDGFYHDDAVTLSLASLDPPCLDEYTDPAVIAENIKVLEEAIARDKLTLQAAEETEKLTRQKHALGQECEKLQGRRRRFSEFQENLANAKEWQKEHDQLEKKSSSYSERLGQLRERQSEIIKDRIVIKGRLTQFITKEETYLANIRALQRPDQSWATRGYSSAPGFVR